MNLQTGALTSLGQTQVSLFGFAADTARAVPEPPAWGFMLVAFGALGFAMRRCPASPRPRFG